MATMEEEMEVTNYYQITDTETPEVPERSPSDNELHSTYNENFRCAARNNNCNIPQDLARIDEMEQFVRCKPTVNPPEDTLTDVTQPKVLQDQTCQTAPPVHTATGSKRPPWCAIIIKNLPFILDHINSVDTVALRLFKDNILPEISCNSIVQNLKRKGLSSAADELMEFFYHDPDMSHHIRFYGILEDTGQQELAQFLRDRTAERGCSGEETSIRNLATLANPGNLTEADIAEKLTEEKTPVYVAIECCSESIVRELLQLDLYVLLEKLQHKFVLELPELNQLTHLLESSRKHRCIIQLNCYLQNKSRSKILKLLDVLREYLNAQTLASFIEEVLHKCERVSEQEREPGIQHSRSPISSRLQIEPNQPNMCGKVMEIMKEIPQKFLAYMHINGEIDGIEKSCIQVNFKVKSFWELENLQKSVACGLFTQRFRSWLKEQDCEFHEETKLDMKLTMFTNYGDSDQPPIEKPLAYHRERDPCPMDAEISTQIPNTEMQTKDEASKEEKLLLPSIDELTEDVIVEEFNEQKTPAYITIAYVSESLVKTLNVADLDTLVNQLREKKILEPTEVHMLPSDRTTCVLLLNCALQKKTEIHIDKFINILAEMTRMKPLASAIHAVLLKCQHAYRKHTKGRRHIQLFIEASSSEILSFDVDRTTTTVKDLKRQIMDKLSTRKIRLEFQGVELTDERTLEDCNLTDRSILYAVTRDRPPGTSPGLYQRCVVTQDRPPGASMESRELQCGNADHSPGESAGPSQGSLIYGSGTKNAFPVAHIPRTHSVTTDPQRSSTEDTEEQVMALRGVSEFSPMSKQMQTGSTVATQGLQNLLGNMQPLEPKDLNVDHNKMLAVGSNGGVYIAELHGKPVAVKEIRIQQRMKVEEFPIALGIDHPSFVQFIGHCVIVKNFRRFLLLVYELIDGDNLDNIINDEQLTRDYQFTLAKRYHVLLQVSQALAYLHGQSPPIVHGDIKPSKIMVSKTGQIKVCGLGLCTLYRYMSNVQTAFAIWVGTPMYMAPELLLDAETSSPMSDVYAFGHLMYEVLFEEHMWEGDDIYHAYKLHNIMKAERIPDKLQEKADHPAYGIIHKCVQFDKQSRPSSSAVVPELELLCEKETAKPV